MKNKTCGECQWYDHHHLLCVIGGDIKPTERAKDCFVSANLTNGDRIRQGGDYALAHFKSEHRCDVCAYAAPIDTAPACRRPEGKICFDGMLAWLNAPADCVAENGDADTGMFSNDELAIKHWNHRPAEDALKAEITRYRRALYNLKEDCTRRKHFAVSDEEKLFLYETISHIEAELDFNTDTGKGGEDE